MGYLLDSTGLARLWAKIKARDEAIVPFVVGTQATTAATATWTGNCPELASLADGQQITYWLPVTGASNVTLNLTLAGGGTTGAIPCYYQGTTRLGTHYAMGSAIHFTYRENVQVCTNVAKQTFTTIAKGWWADANYNTNDNTIGRYVQFYNTIVARSAIANASIIVGDASGYASAADGVSFDMAYPVLWANAAIANGATNYANLWQQTYDRNLATCYPSFTGAKNACVYLVGTLSGSTFTIASPVVTASPPTVADGKAYIPIGRLGNQSSGANYFNFVSSSDVFMFVDGAFQKVAHPLGSGGTAGGSGTRSLTGSTLLGRVASGNGKQVLATIDCPGLPQDVSLGSSTTVVVVNLVSRFTANTTVASVAVPPGAMYGTWAPCVVVALDTAVGDNGDPVVLAGLQASIDYAAG